MVQPLNLFYVIIVCKKWRDIWHMHPIYQADIFYTMEPNHFFFIVLQHSTTYKPGVWVTEVIRFTWICGYTHTVLYTCGCCLVYVTKIWHTWIWTLYVLKYLDFLFFLFWIICGIEVHGPQVWTLCIVHIAHHIQVFTCGLCVFYCWKANSFLYLSENISQYSPR